MIWIIDHPKKLPLYLAISTALLAPAAAHATPIYLLLHGEVTASTETFPWGSSQGLQVGDEITLSATWDSDKMFANDVDASANAARYGTSGVITTYYETIGYGNCGPGCTYPITQLSDGTIWNNANYTTAHHDYVLVAPTVEWSVNGQPATSLKLASEDLWQSPAGWTVQLTTEKSGSGAAIALDVRAHASTVATNFTAFSLNLETANSGVLNDDLLTFVWNYTQSGSADGEFERHAGRVPGITTLEELVRWDRAVLSYDQADLAPVPLPGAAPLFLCAAAGLMALRGRRRPAA